MIINLIDYIVIDPTDGKTIERIEDAVVELLTIPVGEQEEDFHL